MRLGAFLAALLVAVAVSSAGPARAQVFSPGALSKAHTALEGIGSCTKCHVEGGRHDNGKCLECHKEIATRLDANAGYHNTNRSRFCAECHREHRGLGAKLVEWAPSRDAFNHSLAGWPLAGAHKKPECKNCHDVRRIEDDAVRNLATKKGRETYLGLSTECAVCHFDEHRNQEGKACQQCHTPEQPFKKAPGFNHNDRKDARYPLIGKHRAAKCEGCHEPQTDSSTAAGAFPPPRANTYLELKDIPHAQCSACHDDPHRGTFGKSCDRCHTPESWQTIKETAQDTGFHDKHAFKLRGEHQSVACKACHGPFPGQPAKFKGLKFQRCSDCHADAHVGQMALDEGTVRCEKCHTVNGFVPVIYEIDMHKQTRFPLVGSHRSVACNLCHKPEPKLRDRFPRTIRADLERKGRRVIMSEARFDMPGIVADSFDETRNGAAQAPADCEGCHEDAHAGQFSKPAGTAPKPHVEKKKCSDCHAMTSFADLTFKHDDSRFPLTGKHKDVGCTGCHLTQRRRGEQVVIYRGLGTDCATCHVDTHVGQLAKVAPDSKIKGDRGVTDCAACHETSGFKPAKFDHDKQSTFALVGNHKKAKCVACHQAVDVDGTKIARYKPLPTLCAGCHDDEHKKAFDDFNPAPAVPKALAETTPKAGCEGCHAPTGWVPAKFAHERTGFQLTGRHAGSRCAICHRSDYVRAVPATCAGCHVDPHGQEFGLMCNGCHTTDVFKGPAFRVEAHRKTQFPLTGRHAALPCDECHVEKRESSFTRAALDCTFCHANDARKATVSTVNHQNPPFAGVSCGTCHIPTTFSPARFTDHEKCFPISRGKHAPFRCVECHEGLAGTVVTGACSGVPVLCAQCHEHNAELEAKRHATVPGYEHQSAKCAECHPAG